MSIPERFVAAQHAHKRTVRFYARKAVHQLYPMSVDDIEQELLLVMYECCIKYDPNKGARFGTFLQQSFRNKIISLIRFAEAQCRKGENISLSEEAVEYVVNQMLTSKSAEDLAIMRMDIKARVSPMAAAMLDEMVA